MLIARETRLLFCVNKWCFGTYKTCDETKFNGESRDFHETVISSFSALFIDLRDSCSWCLHKGRKLKEAGNE